MQQQPAAAATSFEVGWMFVHEYYTFINKEPAKLHCFYTKKSTLTHGVEGEDTKPCLGQHDIHNKILLLDFQDCKVLVSNVDSQASANGGIIIQVLGEMSNRGGPSRKFSQTFFLAEQPNGYFVLNDIFRYLKEDDVDEDDSELNKSSSIDPFTDTTNTTTTTTTTANTSTSNGWGNAYHEMNGHAHEEQVQHPQSVQAAVQPPSVPALQTATSESLQEPESHRQPEAVAQPVATTPIAPPTQQAATATAPAPAPTPASAQAPAPAPASAPAGPKTWANLVAANKWPQAQAPVTSPPRAQAPAMSPSPVPASPRKRDESVTVFVKGLPDVPATVVQNAANAIAPVKSFEFATNKQHGFLEMESPDAYKAILAQGTIHIENATVQVEERRRPQNASTQKQRQSFDGKNKEQQRGERGERGERGALSGGARGRGRGGKREK